jgi:lipid-A-disaccharide synthase
MSQRKDSLLSRLRNDLGAARRREEPVPAAAEPPVVLNVSDAAPEELTVFVVAGEHSGDVLGAGFMRAMTARAKGHVRFIGVGGEAMEAEGLTSLFPLGDIAVMGPVAILKALPRLVDRVYRTVAAGIAANPDIIVIIDSPEFTHQVGKRLRRKLPATPVIDYVCPSVWAWRPGRARKMARFIDHVLTLLPFEPAALQRLEGPAATYVGHPLSERRDWLGGIDTDAWIARLRLDRGRIPLVVLPGSRRSEVEKLMPVFGDTIRALERAGKRCELLMPCVPHLRARVEELAADWPMRRFFIDDEEGKFAAFRIAHAALAASGTVTLELGVAGTPMVVAYRLDGLAARLRFLVQVDTIVLANLVLEEKAFPEFLQEDCNAEQLSAALIELIEDTPARHAQLVALARLSERMGPLETSPSERAADVVMAYATGKAIAQR